MSRIRIIENCSEIGAGTRGSSLGIDALKVASMNKGSKYFRTYQSTRIKDRNDLLFKVSDTATALRVEGILEVFQNISKAVSETIERGNFPIVLAADHASAGGTIAGLKKSYPDKKIGVVWIDAHGDLHTPYTTPTGNVHGMPLATALAEDNLPSQINEVDERTKQLWTALKELGGIAPKITADDLVFFGVRDTEKPEDDLMERLSIKNFTVEECRRISVEESVKQALERLSHCDLIYISFDVDSMDCDLVSKGTGTPVPNGFSPEEAQQIIELLIDSKKVCCFEMVEVNPTLDNKVNLMAETAFDILEAITPSLEK